MKRTRRVLGEREPEVLRGFERTLAAGRVAAVQFEYGRVSILTRHLLEDFYDFFSSRRCLVGKLYPSYLDVRPLTAPFALDVKLDAMVTWRIWPACQPGRRSSTSRRPNTATESTGGS